MLKKFIKFHNELEKIARKSVKKSSFPLPRQVLAILSIVYPLIVCVFLVYAAEITVCVCKNTGCLARLQCMLPSHEVADVFSY